jgi:hypothetical protein
MIYSQTEPMDLAEKAVFLLREKISYAKIPTDGL